MWDGIELEMKYLFFCPGFWDRLGVEKQSYWALVCTHLFASDEIFPQSWKNGSIEYWTAEKTTEDEKSRFGLKRHSPIIWFLTFLVIQQFGLVLCKVSKAVKTSKERNQHQQILKKSWPWCTNSKIILTMMKKFWNNPDQNQQILK